MSFRMCLEAAMLCVLVRGLIDSAMFTFSVI